MPAILNLAAEFGAGIVGSPSNATGVPAFTFTANASGGAALAIERAGGNSATPTTALITLNVGSTASVAAIQLLGQSFVSATTIAFTTGAVAGTGGIRVLYPDGVTFGWIPVLPSGSVTGAARG